MKFSVKGRPTQTNLDPIQSMTASIAVKGGISWPCPNFCVKKAPTEKKCPNSSSVETFSGAGVNKIFLTWIKCLSEVLQCLVTSKKNVHNVCL